MSTRFRGPLPVPAGAQTRHPRTSRWWAALAPELASADAGAARLQGDAMAFTVHAPDAHDDVLAAQQLRGDIVVEVSGERLTIATLVAGVENRRTKPPLRRRLLDRSGDRVWVGASVPVEAVSRIEVDVEHPTRSGDAAEQEHIAAHGHGWPISARLRCTFAVDSNRCEVAVDLHRPSVDDERDLWLLCERLADARGADAVLPVRAHPAEPPAHHRRTLRLALPDARPVALE